MHPRLSPTIALSAAFLLVAAAQGQSTGRPQSGRRQPGTPTSTPAPPTAVPKTHDPSVVEFGETPLRVESAGLTIMLPLHSQSQSSSAGSRTAAQIVGDDKTWLINIQTPRSATDATSAQVCDSIVTEYFKAAGEVYDVTQPQQPAGYKGTILEPRKQVTIDKMPAERVYFSVPASDPKEPTVVRGVTVLKNAANQFLIFELVTTEPTFARSKAIYETTVQTAQIEDPTRINNERAAAIAAGERALQSLGPSAVQDLIKTIPERWERRYKPAPSGLDADAEELGYRRIKVFNGSRGDLNTRGGMNPAGAGNRQQGIVVQMDARIREAGYMIDSQAAFFLSPDQNIESSEEAWSVRNAIRKDGKTDILTEIGARTGKSMVVNVEGTGMPQRTIKPVFQGDGYISRVESWLLPQLLLKAGVTADFGFYTFQSESGGICLRRDTLEQPVDKPGLWKLTTKVTEEKKAQVSYYNAKGELIRTEMPDGSIWEPTTIEKLKQLWESKHLPMN